MNLEVLTKRLADIDAAMTNMSQQYNAMAGQKIEVKYWMEELKNEAEVLSGDVIPAVAE